MAGLNKTMSKVRVFKEAGRICLIRHKDDGGNSRDPGDIYTSDRTVVDNVATTFSRTNEDLNDGNSMWPAASYQTGITASSTPTLNTVDMDLWAFVTGAKKVIQKNASVPKISMEYTIEKTEGGGRIALDTKLNRDGLFVLREQWSGADYLVTEGDGFPAASGQVRVDYDTGELKFHADDAGKVVYVSCEFIVEESVNYQLPEIPPNYIFTLILSGASYDKDETDKLYDTYVVDCCKATGDISAPPRQKMPNGWSITFTIQKPRPGKPAIDWGAARPATGILKTLEIASTIGAESGKTKLTVTPEKSASNSYVYQVGSALALPSYGDILVSGWTVWNGTDEVDAAAGDQIAVAEINGNKECVGAGRITVTVNP